MDWLPFLPTASLIFINTVVLLFVIKNYITTRNQTLKLLGTSVFFFLLSSVMRFFLILSRISFEESGIGSINEIFSTLLNFAFLNIFTIVSIYFLILFFQSFRDEVLFTRRNVWLAIATAVILVGTLLNIFYLRLLFDQNIEFDISPDGAPVLSDTSTLALALFVSTGVFIFLSGILILVVGVMFIREVGRSLNSIENPALKSNARLMKWSVYIMVVAGFLSGNGLNPSSDVFSTVALMIFIIAMLGFVISYLRGGLFFLQGDDLKRLIIINPTGQPIYSYNFRKFKHKQNQSLTESDNQEVLFSGALKSISILLAEFTGGDQNVSEIRLEDMVMMIHTFENGSSAVLMVDQSSRFVREALNEFSNTMRELVEEIKPGLAFSTDETKVANEIIEEIFGQTYAMTKNQI